MGETIEVGQSGGKRPKPRKHHSHLATEKFPLLTEEWQKKLVLSQGELLNDGETAMNAFGILSASFRQWPLGEQNGMNVF